MYVFFFFFFFYFFLVWRVSKLGRPPPPPRPHSTSWSRLVGGGHTPLASCLTRGMAFFFFFLHACEIRAAVPGVSAA